MHPKTNVDRLYVTREDGGKNWVSVEYVVRVEEHSLLDYLKKAEVNLDKVSDVFVKEETGTD